MQSWGGHLPSLHFTARPNATTDCLLRRPQALVSRFWHIALHLNSERLPSRLSQIVGGLQRQPRLGGAAKSLIEPDRHFGRNSGLFIDEIVQRLTSNAQNLRAGGY